MKALLGIKLGMTRIFDANGKMIPVTAIQAGPCTVTQVKTIEKDGYNAIQLGLGASRHPKKPQTGHAKAASVEAPQFLKEFRTDDIGDAAVGTVVSCEQFEIGGKLKLTGISKGKGFSGVIKRHHFSRGPETHGSDHHRAPGSIGSMFPQHVLKGQKMPGHMGNEQITVRKVDLVDVYSAENLLFVKGPVPGIRGSLVEISAM